MNFPNFILLGGLNTHCPDAFELMGNGMQRMLFRKHGESDKQLWSRVQAAADLANRRGHRTELIVLCVYGH